MIGSRPSASHSSRNLLIFGSIVGRNAWPPKPGSDGHDQHDVAQVQHVFDQLGRGGRVEHHARLLAEVADLAEDAMQVDGRRRLGLDQQVIGAGPGEIAPM